MIVQVVFNLIGLKFLQLKPTLSNQNAFENLVY